MVIVNDEEIDVQTTENSIVLPKKSLHKGKNVVSVLYKNAYNEGDDAGFVSFT